MIYPNFFWMADAILAHVAATGDKILPLDSPVCRLIGFCSDKLIPDDPGPDGSVPGEYARFHDHPYIFAVTLTACRARNGTDTLSASEHEAWGNYMRTAEGRRLMAEAFSRGERLWQTRDTVQSPPPV